MLQFSFLFHIVLKILIILKTNDYYCSGVIKDEGILYVDIRSKYGRINDQDIGINIGLNYEKKLSNTIAKNVQVPRKEVFIKHALCRF